MSENTIAAYLPDGRHVEIDDDEDDSACRNDDCDDSTDDGEGYDGLCGNCADAATCSECGEEKHSEAMLCPSCTSSGA